jgi:hypothetical protein
VQEISFEVHARRSKEQAATSGLLQTFDAADANTTHHSGESGKTTPEPHSLSDQHSRRHRHWLEITDNDRTRSYALGAITLDAHVVIEVFRQYAFHVWTEEAMPVIDLIVPALRIIMSPTHYSSSRLLRSRSWPQGRHCYFGPFS